jgi:intein/homing endonuclease
MPATKTNKYMLICEGDCLEENTLIFSISDNKNIKIKDIQIGDLVLTHNQCIKPIVSKTSKLINCFKLKLKSGKEIICSKEHRFFVYDSVSNTFKWKKLKNLNKETDKLINNKLIQGMFFDKINIEKNEDKKYKLKISGDTYSCISSLEHRFVVFNKNEEKFEILKAKDLNQKYLMVLLNKDFQND